MRTIFLLALLALAHCGGSAADPVALAQAWPEADDLFRSDPRWLGGANASSVDLGSGKTLWLFGNSFVDPLATGDRSLAFLVANTMALQDGADPATAGIEFFWGDRGGDPAAFFPDENGDWFWPVQGLRVGSTLTVFGSRIRPDPFGDPFRFATVRAEAFRIDDADASPLDWTPHALALPDAVSAVFREGGFVYAYVVASGERKDVFVLRWSEAAFLDGRLDAPEWWDGAGWGPEVGRARRVLREGADQFSVTRDAARARLVLVESHGFGGSFLADQLTIRFAPEPAGPWGALRTLFRPQEALRGRRVPGGKAHPQLRGADLIATYVPEDGAPRFVRIDFLD